ncbi:hypothetical protein RGV33_26050 [Pseudomonas sp. Bout1]|uniref:hypothetical protein n=1 Tax=Pseudomonas sp. Bout1 TaxID=3048600 RepID=UPI002AB4DD92|nr:hypothetical protein [Pseudomonas sp. Bout1]MDY7535100.1 hypothetical protein [Pseudomonas sp. Bout1]MEB0184563.1 hypothetical protein [Pseudomonas sp. Bout1]
MDQLDILRAGAHSTKPNLPAATAASLPTGALLLAAWLLGLCQQLPEQLQKILASRALAGT